jgi:Putative Ig domain
MSVAPLAINLTKLPDAAVGTFYSTRLPQNGGGLLPLTWTIVTGTLPPGLSLSPTGLIEGTPQQASQAWITFAVTDSGVGNQQQSANARVFFVVGAPSPLDPSNPNAKFIQDNYLTAA